MAIYAELPETESQLALMGLAVHDLVRVVRAASGGFNSTTRFHPSSAPGTYLYQEGTAALRRVTDGREDWEFDEDDSQPRTFSEARGVAIVLQTGDENTGLIGGPEPKPRNPKGEATLRKITRNSDQLALFNLSVSPSPDHGTASILTWVLLVAVVGDVVRAELSLPRTMGSDRKPCGWVHRILLPEQPIGGAPTIGEEFSGEETSVDVDVNWKQ